MCKVGCLGPEGSYSHLASEKFLPNSRIMLFPSFHGVFFALVTGECDYIAVPIENSANGGVLQVMDLLQGTEDIFATRELTLKIDHRLCYKEGTNLKSVTKIYSHIQALEQCGNYLLKNFPSAQLIPTSSTAASLEKLQDGNTACIVGSHIKRDGLILSEDCIADSDNNSTHFLLVERGKIPTDKVSKRIYFSMTSINKAGALLQLLQCIYDHGLNMTKIESRPIKTLSDEYRFFIEAEGDYSTEKIKLALKDVESKSVSLKLLGAY